MLPITSPARRKALLSSEFVVWGTGFLSHFNYFFKDRKQNRSGLIFQRYAIIYPSAKSRKKAHYPQKGNIFRFSFFTNFDKFWNSSQPGQRTRNQANPRSTFHCFFIVI